MNFKMICTGIYFAVSSFNILASISVPMYSTDKPSKNSFLGTVSITETKYGLLLKPNLNSLTPGTHGFHIHQEPNCADHGMAAGGHYDPKNTKKHLGPYNDNGHLGDLPVLIVNNEGQAKLPVIAPKLKTLKEIKNRTLMIHKGGDNYSDTPVKLGGGGARIGCGVIKQKQK